MRKVIELQVNFVVLFSTALVFVYLMINCTVPVLDMKLKITQSGGIFVF